MIIKILTFLSIFIISLWYYKNTKKYGILWIAKGTLQIGILILFVGGFFRLFITLPPNPYIKIIFFLIYLWCTVGINVNFMIPLLNLINQKIENKN